MSVRERESQCRALEKNVTLMNKNVNIKVCINEMGTLFFNGSLLLFRFNH
jgi:hypothetical protein